MMKLIYIASAALLATSVYAAVPGKVSTGSEFVKMAGASDKFELESSQMVLKTTKDTKARDYAAMMVADHTKTTAEVKAAAKEAGIMPKPPMLNTQQAKMIAELKKAPAASRDKIYIAQQVKSHEMALALHQGYSTDGDKAPLKAVAAKAVPIVTQHLEIVRQINTAM